MNCSRALTTSSMIVTVRMPALTSVSGRSARSHCDTLPRSRLYGSATVRSMTVTTSPASMPSRRRTDFLMGSA